jgi:hypothetical protein
VSLRNHWCWVPGPRDVRPVYAPALVGWAGNPPSRYSATGRGVRWFPLAPHEVYVPSYKHTPRHARRVNQANTVIDDANIARAYTARDPVREYRNRADANAVTVGERAMWVNPQLRPGPNIPRTVGEGVRPAPPMSQPPTAHSPAAPSQQGSSAPASQSSRPAVREAAPRRSSQPQQRDTSRPMYHQP